MIAERITAAMDATNVAMQALPACLPDNLFGLVSRGDEAALRGVLADYITKAIKAHSMVTSFEVWHVSTENSCNKGVLNIITFLSETIHEVVPFMSTADYLAQEDKVAVFERRNLNWVAVNIKYVMNSLHKIMKIWEAVYDHKVVATDKFKEMMSALVAHMARSGGADSSSSDSDTA